MIIRLKLTGCDYEMNNPNGRIALREHLRQKGFFNHPENKNLWDIFERSEAGGEEAKAVQAAIKLFDEINTGGSKKA